MTDNLYMTGATPDECWPLVRGFHYSKRMPTAIRHCFAWREPGGLFGDTGEPQAVIIYGQPVNRNWPQEALELQRLVRKEDFKLPLSQFISWSLRWLRENTSVPFVISYADNGQNHHGGIYQATNWLYVSERKPRLDYFLDEFGNEHWTRKVAHKYGTMSIEKVLFLNKGWVPVYGDKRYLYVFPLNLRKRKLLKKFEWDELPYPKPDAEARCV